MDVKSSTRIYIATASATSLDASDLKSVEVETKQVIKQDPKESRLSLGKPI